MAWKGYNEQQAMREGWILADVDSTGYLEIQKYDESDAFASDDEANAYLTERAAKGYSLARIVFELIAESHKAHPVRPV
jgi:hypothetical protein